MTKRWLVNGKKVDRDYWWYLLEEWKITHIGNGDLGLFRNICYEQSIFLKKEEKLSQRLNLLCIVNYYDINGAQNSGMGFDKSDGFFAPSPLAEMFEVVEQLGLTRHQAKETFVKSSGSMKSLPISPESAFEMAVKRFGYSE